MSDILSPGHPEFVPDDDIAAAEALDVKMLEALYQDDLHTFRAEVMLLLMSHGIRTDNSWVMFNIDDFDDSGVLQCSGHDLAILSFTAKVVEPTGVRYMPYIRVLESQRYSVDLGVDYFTIDVTVDEDGDAQHLVGAYPQRADIDSNESTVPVVMPGRDGLLMTSLNFGKYTNRSRYKTVVEGEVKEAEPFGFYEFLYDKHHALTVAKGMIAKTRDLEPLATGQLGLTKQT